MVDSIHTNGGARLFIMEHLWGFPDFSSLALSDKQGWWTNSTPIDECTLP